MDAALDQMLARVRAAVADHTPLRICGGGSKDFHALQLQGMPLDTRALRGVVSYEPSELVVTVRAGTPLAELEALLAAHGQCLAFEPPHLAGAAGASATVGGMVAAGWSGPARASVGAVRDFVLGIELINGRAELLRFGGTVMKNVAGYDVARLMAGSWGTLGLITEVSLKVLPLSVGEATLRFAGVGQAQALQNLNTWGGQPLPLNASLWQQEDGEGVLYVRLRGARAAVETACQRLGGECLAPQRAAAWWQDGREQALPWFQNRQPQDVLWRLSLPPSAPPLVLPQGIGAPLIEWHGAQRWLQAPRAIGPQLHALAQAAGGHAVLWRPEATQAITGAPLFAPLSAPLQRIHRQLKHAFDPAGLWNPGRTQA